MSSVIKRTYNACIILQRDDGYWNASAMCRANGKTWSHYRENRATEEFVEELSRSLGIPRDVLVRTEMAGPNEVRGTWVHPRIAVNLAQWCSARFAVLVSGWVEELLTKGHIDLRPAATTVEDPILALLQNAALTLQAVTQTRQAQLALEHKVDVVNETAAQASDTALEAKDMAEAALRVAEGKTGCYTVKGYANLLGLRISTKVAAWHGKRLSKICRERGIKMNKAPDENWGEVNSYPEDVLHKYFERILNGGTFD